MWESQRAGAGHGEEESWVERTKPDGVQGSGAEAGRCVMLERDYGEGMGKGQRRERMEGWREGG